MEYPGLLDPRFLKPSHSQEGRSWTVLFFRQLTCFLSSGTSRENPYQDCSVCKQTSPVAASQFSVLERHQKRKSYLVQGAGMLFYNFICLFVYVSGYHQETGSNSCHEVSCTYRELTTCLFFLENALAREARIWKVLVFQNLTVKVSSPVPSLKDPAKMHCWSCHLTHLNAKVIPHGLGLRNGGGEGSVFVPFYILLMPCINQGLCILFWLSQNSSSFRKCEIVWDNVVEQVRAASRW